MKSENAEVEASKALVTEDLWFRAVGQPTPLRHSVFGGSFNIEYWSAELFCFCKDPDTPKVFEVVHEEGRVGRIEVSSFKNQHLKPFDRLVLLALMGLWHDQGCDPQGRIAFSYRELFRRLDLKAGGRQDREVQGALDRLRRCWITQLDSFMIRTKDGGVVPFEREEDPFTLLSVKRTATIGSGKNGHTLVVAQLGEAVLFGLAGEFLQPRIAAEHLKRLNGKMHLAILLHGYFNGRLRPGETRHFPFDELARALRVNAPHRSTRVARLLPPLGNLEDAGVVTIAEPRATRRKAEGVTVTLAIAESLPVARPPEARACELFPEVRPDPNMVAGFVTLGVKLQRVLERLGVVADRTLWSLLEEMRLRTWPNAEEAERFAVEQLEAGYEPPRSYVPPPERFRKKS